MNAQVENLGDFQRIVGSKNDVLLSHAGEDSRIQAFIPIQPIGGEDIDQAQRGDARQGFDQVGHEHIAARADAVDLIEMDDAGAAQFAQRLVDLALHKFDRDALVVEARSVERVCDAVKGGETGRLSAELDIEPVDFALLALCDLLKVREEMEHRCGLAAAGRAIDERVIDWLFIEQRGKMPG